MPSCRIGTLKFLNFISLKYIWLNGSELAVGHGRSGRGSTMFVLPNAMFYKADPGGRQTVRLITAPSALRFYCYDGVAQALRIGWRDLSGDRGMTPTGCCSDNSRHIHLALFSQLCLVSLHYETVRDRRTPAGRSSQAQGASGCQSCRCRV